MGTSNSDFEESLRRDYIIEARDLIAEAEDCFLTLEKDPDSHDVIDRIFRIVHTVKGSGSVAGFEAFARFAHHFENLLTLIRADTLSINQDIIDLMLESNDVLKTWVEELDTDPAFEVNTSAIVERLAAYCVPLQGETKKSSLPAFGFFEDEPSAAPVAASDGRAPTILLVDDEPDILDVYESYLEDTQAKTLRALDGTEAVEILQQVYPDVIVTDLKMPKMNGLDLIKYVRKKRPDVPCIFVSGASDRSDVISLLNSGAFAFIDKPVTREDLLGQIRNALRERFTRDLIMQLTQLNFMAFLTSTTLAKSREATARKKHEEKLRGILDEITVVQNSILEARFPNFILSE